MSESINQKSLYLSGGGDENTSFTFDKFFFESLPKNKRFLYIPIALRGHDMYKHVDSWMKGVIDLHKRSDLDLEIWKDFSSNKSFNLDDFDGIYIGGGNTWILMGEFKKYSFDVLLSQYINKGGIVYGGSAGAIIFGKKINTQDDENLVNLRDYAGLSMIGDYSLSCHFNKNESDKLKKWSQDNELPIICLPEGSGIIVESKNKKCIGTQGCFVSKPNGEFVKVDSGELI